MSIDSKIFQVLTPASDADMDAIDFELLLTWRGRKGQYYNYLFTDWENKQKNSNTILNLESITALENIPFALNRTIDLVIEDISLNDLQEYLSVLSAKLIVMKSGVNGSSYEERVGIVDSSSRFKQSGKRYNFNFTIQRYDKELPQ